MGKYPYIPMGCVIGAKVQTLYKYLKGCTNRRDGVHENTKIPIYLWQIRHFTGNYHGINPLFDTMRLYEESTPKRSFRLAELREELRPMSYRGICDQYPIFLNGGFGRMFEE
jgi:hypothetical protein